MSNSSSANKRVASKILEVSADLFYRKVRDEADTAEQKNSASKENFVDELNVIDEKFYATNEILSGNNSSPGKKFLANAENISDKLKLAKNVNVANEKHFADENCIPTKKYKESSANPAFPTSNKNIEDIINIASEKFMDTNFSPEIDYLPVNPPANQNNIASQNFIPENTLPEINLSLGQLSPCEESNAMKSIAITDLISTSEKNLASDKNFPSAEIKESSSSSSLNILNITTTSKISDDETEFTVKSKKTRRNVPVENYDSTLIKLAALIGMPSLGILLTLRSILPPDGGNIRVNAFARSIDMSANNVRIQLENLQSKGLIATVTGGEEGKWVSFTDDSLKSAADLFVASVNNIGGKENFGSEINISSDKNFLGINKFTFPLRSKEFYFTCLKVAKTPESFQPAVVRKWIGLAERESPEYAVAALLEFVPNAKTNPSAYLHTMLENGVKPSPANVEAAKQLLEAIGNINRTIGEEILPKDWIQATGKFGIRIKMGNIQELTFQQTAIMAKLEKFTSQLL
ncbi:MAG: hypothetical protein LBT65_07220 [Synergistaceae bacterium]|jgi:hypothetical protein|nr:hypothetical protein [Synergistaceae bacterium]